MPGDITSLLSGDNITAKLLGLVVLLVVFGLLVPRWTHQRMVNQERRRADEYKAAAESKDKTIALLAEHVAESIEHQRTTTAIVKAIPHPDPIGDGGDRQ